MTENIQEDFGEPQHGEELRFPANSQKRTEACQETSELRSRFPYTHLQESLQMTAAVANH